MPITMIRAWVISMPNVNGSSRAMASVAVSPGMAPKISPMRKPPSRYRKGHGVNSVAKPPKSSPMASEVPAGKRQAEDALEEHPAEAGDRCRRQHRLADRPPKTARLLVVEEQGDPEGKGGRRHEIAQRRQCDGERCDEHDVYERAQQADARHGLGGLLRVGGRVARPAKLGDKDAKRRQVQNADEHNWEKRSARFPGPSERDAQFRDLARVYGCEEDEPDGKDRLGDYTFKQAHSTV